MNSMKVSDWILSRLAQEGVKSIFLVPGGAAMHLNDSLAKTPDIMPIAVFHENAAALAAECYAKVINQLGVAMVTAGPGSTNAITAVVSAWVNSAPLLVLSGQVKRADLNPGGLRQSGLQEVDIVSIVGPVTKYAVAITDPTQVRFHVEKALHLARTGRPGPVWLCLPMDVQSAQMDAFNQIGYLPEATPEQPVAACDIDRLIGLLNASERPVLLAGAGIRIGRAERRFLELVETLGIPVQTTWVGADIVPADHPLYAGRPGAFASRGANFTMQNSDFMFALGARLDLATTAFSRQRFARAAKRVAVDVDPKEIAKLHDVLDLAIVASAGDVIEALLARRAEFSGRDRRPWLARTRKWLADYPIVTPDLRRLPSRTSTYVLVEKLGELLEKDDVIVEGSAGIHSEIFFMMFENKAGQRILADGSFGSMGYGLPAAIGACIAAGRRRTILVEGDGSLQPNLQELQTLVREQLPLKIIVVNNGGFSSIRASQSHYFQRLLGADATSGLTLPEVSRIASAYGIRSIRIESSDELEAKLQEALSGVDPVLCEVLVPVDEDRVPRLGNSQRPDGTMVSKPMEDMFPFLDRDEFQRNMIIEPLSEG